MIDPAIIGVISASTALVASIAGPMVTLYVARAQIRAAVRSNNRQKWIDEFRELIASFCAQIAATTQVHEQIFKDGRLNIPSESEFLRHFERLIFTSVKIRLMVNPLDEKHIALLGVVNGLLMRFRSAAPGDDLQDEAQATAKTIIDMSLLVIRREWQRVQHGA